MTPNPIRDLYAFQLTHPSRESWRRPSTPAGPAQGRNRGMFLALVLALASAVACAGLYWLI